MRSFVLIALAVAIGSTRPAVAQSSNIEGRVGRLEKEMKAVQRKVFPGGGSQYFEPQIAPAPATPTQDPGTPASSTRSEEHTSELKSLMRTSYDVLCFKH